MFDTSFGGRLSDKNIGNDFLCALEKKYQEFTFQIMSDMTLYKYKPERQYLFAEWGLGSKEYDLQKYFESRTDLDGFIERKEV